MRWISPTVRSTVLLWILLPLKVTFLAVGNCLIWITKLVISSLEIRTSLINVIINVQSEDLLVIKMMTI